MEKNSENKISQIRVGILLTYIQILLVMVVNIITTPIMTKYLGQAEFGLYNTISSTVAMFSILSLGFSSSYIKFFSIYKEENDQESIKKLNGMFLLVFVTIAVISLIIGIYLTFNLHLVFSDGLKENEYIIGSKLMLILAFNMATSFPIIVFQNIIVAYERFIFSKFMSIVRTVAPPLATIPFLLFGYNSVAVALVTTLVILMSDLIIVIYSLKELRVKFDFKRLEFSKFKELYVFTAFIAINFLVDQINWNSGQILLGRYQGTEAVAVFSIGFTLYTYFQNLSISISNLFVPRIHQIVNRNTDNKIQQGQELTDIFIKVGRIQYMILSLAALGLIFFGKDFITKYWVGEEYSLSYLVIVILIVSGMTQRVQSISLEIQRALDKYRFRTLVYFVIIAINIVLYIVFIKKYSVLGATVVFASSLVVGDGIIMNFYYHLQCNIDMIRYWREMIRISTGFIIPIIFGVFINKFSLVNNIAGFVVYACVYVIVYLISIWLFSMNEYEKGIFRQIISRILRKKA